MATSAYGGNIAWTASEAKNTEKKTAVISLDGEVSLNANYRHLVQLERSMSNTAGMVTVNIYNVSKVDGTNARDTLIVQATVSTSTDYKSVEVENLFLGTEEQIKIGAVHAANITGSAGAGNLYYKIFRV